MTDKVCIYVTLLNEAVDVRRPVEAKHLGGDFYLILDQEYDREIEEWEFEPGDKVRCSVVASDVGRILLAVSANTGTQ